MDVIECVLVFALNFPCNLGSRRIGRFEHPAFRYEIYTVVSFVICRVFTLVTQIETVRLLERWRSGQPLYHELLPDWRVRLEQRLPLCRCCSADFDSGGIPQPSALEAAPIRTGGRGERGKGAEPAAGRKDQGRAVRFNHVFWLLCTGAGGGSLTTRREFPDTSVDSQIAERL